MIRTATVAFAALLLVALPAAFAQDEGNQTTENPAWVQDCPPDMMCAASEGNATDNTNDTKPHVDCPPGETCTDKAAGGARSPQGNATSDNCMDGQQEGEVCDGNVYYMTPPPTRGPANGTCEECRGDVASPLQGSPENAQTASDAASKTVPAFSVIAVFVAFAVAVGVVARLRK